MSDSPNGSRSDGSSHVARPDWTRLAIVSCLAYFAARLVYFAFAIDGAIPPDEATHLGRVQLFATTWGIPTPGPDNYALGLFSERPFVYNWVLGRLLGLSSGLLSSSSGLSPTSELMFLRLVNVALALGTAVYALRFIRVVTPDRLAHVVFLVLFTNALMFTGIGAAVSYDNGANLLGAASFYYFARLLSDWKPNDLGALAVTVGLGCLTKRSFLPVAALIAGAIVLHERRHLRHVGARLRGMALPLAAAAVAIALANVALYGGNVVKYGHLVPSFDQVVGIEAAQQNRIFARDTILDGFLEGRLEFREAMKRTTAIPHAGDRESTRRQLAGLQRRGNWRVAPHKYAMLWGRIMLDRTFGYFGHQVIYRSSGERAGYIAVLLAAIGMQAWAWRRRANPIARWGGAIALAYALIVFGPLNYANYVTRGILDAGVHGRYLFPVWAPLIGWLTCALVLVPPPLRWVVAGLVGAIFIAGDFPVFWLRATPVWFGGSP